MAEEEPSGDEMEDTFTEKYYRLLDIAFDFILGPENGAGESVPNA